MTPLQNFTTANFRHPVSKSWLRHWTGSFQILQVIGSKILIAEREKLPLKFTCPCWHFNLAVTPVNKGELHCGDSICPKHYITSAASQGLVLLTQLPFLFAEFTCNLPQGKWLCCTLSCHFFASLAKWPLSVPWKRVITLTLLVANFAITKLCKKSEKDAWNSGKWVLIWEYSARVFQWIPTW